MAEEQDTEVRRRHETMRRAKESVDAAWRQYESGPVGLTFDKLVATAQDFSTAVTMVVETEASGLFPLQRRHPRSDNEDDEGDDDMAKRKKFSTKNKLTTSKTLAAAGRALEGRLETWIGRLRKRVSRNEQELMTTKGRVKDLERTVKQLQRQIQTLLR